jgi:hypothetical protein
LQFRGFYFNPRSRARDRLEGDFGKLGGRAPSHDTVKTSGFFYMKRTLLSIALLATSLVTARAQDFFSFSTSTTVQEVYTDNLFGGYSVSLQLFNPDVATIGPSTVVSFARPDGKPVGGTAGGYSYTDAESEFVAAAGDFFSRLKQVPNGLYTISLSGGLYDGVVQKYSVDVTLLPRVTPRLRDADLKSLKQAPASSSIVIHVPQAKPDPAAVPGFVSISIADLSAGFPNEIYFTYVDPKSSTVKIPADTFGSGMYQLVLTYSQNGRATGDELSVRYTTSNTVKFERK